MTQQNSTRGSWNVFARELLSIIEHHGGTIWSLNTKAGIHPERIRLLQESLTHPIIATLNPSQLRAVQKAFSLTAEEILHLKAAIIVTAIAAMMMDRIQLDLIERVTTKLLPIMDELIAEDAKKDRIFIGIEGDEMPKEESLEGNLQPIVEAIEKASLAYHLSEASSNFMERIKNAQEAQQAYQDSLTALIELPLHLRQSEIWRYWSEEAQEGLDAVSQVLARAKAIVPTMFSD